MEDKTWRKCATCKKSIDFCSPYWVCNVSTCNKKRTGLAFCSVECWDGHLPIARHRSAWSLEMKAPSKTEWERMLKEMEELGNETISSDTSNGNTGLLEARKEKNMAECDPTKDILVVASKLKAYIRLKSDMNTAAEVLELLSNMLRTACDEAILKARQDGRRTVMARDF